MSNLHVAPLGVALLVIPSVFLCLAFAAVSLRLYCVHLLHRPLRTHDYLILIGLVVTCGHVTIEYLEVALGGLGNHIETLPKTVLPTILKLFVADNFTWLFATTAIKLSALFLYLDLFGSQKNFRRVAYGFIAFVVTFFVAFLVSIVTICQPFSHYWNITGPGFCGSLTASQIATSSINTLIDLSIMLLPIAPIWNLHMSQSKKVKLSLVFGVGAIISLINIARLVCVLTLDQVDETYSLTPSAILTALEVELGIICVCLPTINPIFRLRSEKQQSELWLWGTKPTWRTTVSTHKKSRQYSTDPRVDLDHYDADSSHITVSQNINVQSESE